MKKGLFKALALTIAIGMLAACSSPAATPAPDGSKEAPQAKKRIGISLVYKGDEWCAAVADEFEKQAAEFGFEVNIQDGNLNNETQTTQLENFTTQNYDMIFIDPIDSQGIVPAIESARAAEIPVMAFDSPANYDDLVSYVSWDSFETGQIIGKYLHDRIKNEMGGKAKIVVLTCATPVAIGERIKGFKDALKDLDITYVSEQDYEANREKAANIVTNIKEDFDFVVAGQDNGAWGALSACQALNKPEVEVYSMGAYGEECFTTLLNGDNNYSGSVAVSPSELVKSCYVTAQQYFEGKKDIPSRVNINLDLVNKENIAAYMEKNGISY